MVIAAIYVVILVAFTLLGFGYYKQDYPTLFFAASVFVFLGLNIIVNGFQDLARTYQYPLAYIFILFGAYIGIRSGIEFIQENY